MTVANNAPDAQTPSREPEFIQIPLNVLRDTGLSPAAKLVYGRLKLYQGKHLHGNPKHETLAREVCLEKRQIQNTLNELQERGWIDWTRTRTSCLYTVFSDRQETAELDMQETASQIGNKLHIRSAENCLSRSAKNCRQKRSIENHHQKEVSEKSAGVVCETASVVERNPVPAAKPENQPPNPVSENADDDEKNQTPEQVFVSRVRRRHGDTVDADKALRDVKAELKDINLTAFLEADQQATTGKLKNPHGHYRKLARDPYKRAQTENIETILKASQPMVNPVDTWTPPVIPDSEKCGQCGHKRGKGLVLNGEGQYVNCPACQEPKTA